MSSIGPDLPPHLLAKRKRQQEEDSENTKADLPSRSPDGSEKRQRVAGPVMGPAAPPAPLDERPSGPAKDSGDDSDSSDDDFGPAIPTGNVTEANNAASSDDDDLGPKVPTVTDTAGPKRDDWMMMPPTADGLSASLDPAKRARGFRSGPKANLGSGGGGAMDASWTETPEEKRKRLADQVMGVSAEKTSSKTSSSKAKSRQDEESARRIKEHADKHRGKSLFEEHKTSKTAEKEDDPSKRAFDREKDIGSNMFGRDREREMKKQAANFGSKFSGGKYL